MFGFPKSDRPKNFQFNQNFLKSVIFQVKFEKNDCAINSKDKIIKKLESIYPNHKVLAGVGFGFKLQGEKTPVIEDIKKKEEALEFKSKDLNKNLLITSDAITLTCLGKGYKNFDLFLQEIQELKSLYELCKIKAFNRVAIRKINIVEFSTPEGKNELASDFLQVFFNNALTDNIMTFPNRELINQGLTNLSYVSGDDRLNLQYGLLPFNIKTQRNSIVLDVDIFNVNKEFSIGNLNTKLSVINQEIFNIFNWVISDDAREFLNMTDNG